MLDLLVHHGSYLGIVLFLILTGCGLPVPEEVVVVMSGALSAQGTLHPPLALAACVIGALAGDFVMYAIGYHFGHSLLKDHPRFARFLRADREPKFEALINQHGLKMLLAGRFMVGVRSPLYLSAGALRIPWRRFLLMDLLCATLVVGLVFGLAYALGEAVVTWIRRVETGATVTALMLASVGVFFYVRRQRRLRSTRQSSRAAGLFDVSERSPG